MRFLLFLILVLFSCSTKQDVPASPAFYHWKNKLELSTEEQQFLTQLSSKKIYLRFFDVDWQGGEAIPLSIINVQKKLPDTLEIVPVVFITNRTMLNTGSSRVDKLGERILKKINDLSQKFSNPVSEIQIDCDWTQQSRKTYFSFLNYLRSRLKTQKKTLSVTIRLHQIKYFQRTGVPEVDRGVLMFYNTGNVDEYATENSILRLSTAEKYLYNFDNYPLELDVALPVFRWGIVFQDEKFVRIINKLNVRDLQDTTRFVKLSENRFELLKSTYLKGYYLYQKDQIRLESVAIDDLRAAAKMLSEALRSPPREVIFYHLDSTLIADYPYEVLQDICDHFY